MVSLLVYLRDAPRVKIFMRFDMNGLGSQPDHLHCVIVVVNVGRRSIHLARPPHPQPLQAITVRLRVPVTL
jgi:hypothetical protein